MDEKCNEKKTIDYVYTLYTYPMKLHETAFININKK